VSIIATQAIAGENSPSHQQSVYSRLETSFAEAWAELVPISRLVIGDPISMLFCVVLA